MRGVAALNAPLIGTPDSRAMLETPALVLDAAAFEANTAQLAALSGAHGMGLRPHAKTHKCATIAKRQLALGANGIACAKPGELLALFEAGIRPLMLTAPIASARKIARLADAAARGAELTVVVDRVDLVEAFASAARAAGARIDVLIDCDTGLGRTGVVTADEAVALARAVAAEDSLRYVGVQAYAGLVQHVHAHVDRRAANDAANARLRAILDGLEAAGLAASIVSGGGTGSHLLDFEAGLLTEVQAGSYIFMDEGYQPVDFHGTETAVFATALFVDVTVVAHSAAGEAITDAGSKSLAIDGPPPRVFRDGVEIGRIEWAGDEFGRVKTAAGHEAPAPGTRLACTVPHCDPTANLHDFIHIVRDGRLVEIWAIEGRGLSD
ncbi:alanine racemase [Acuticoccus kandeliae]|uniref:alanine racemase n=1 Tax=Acuticoccus kandeliae TaxID=2073160 RepID=UPI000D3EC9A1|nr:alanine racemase [Acuticoccus kandeliae]